MKLQTELIHTSTYYEMAHNFHTGHVSENYTLTLNTDIHWQADWKLYSYVVGNKGKGKAIQLQAWTGPEGSRMLRLPDFKTIGTWRWYVCQPYTPAPLYPQGNIPGTHFC